MRIIDISDFDPGRKVQQYEYMSFSPSLINARWEVADADLLQLLSSADRSIGELNAYSRIVPDVDFFINMYVSKEATTSSRIEGTQTNIKEAMEDTEDLEPERRDDQREVRNHIRAINFAIEKLERLPLSSRLIRQTHEILMDGVRGERKMPGEYRKSQNWIGPGLKKAYFVPPHHNELPDLMSDLELFAHSEDTGLAPLLKAAVLHYQFETIHPFLDGNGRMGRLLISLFLVSQRVLAKSSLYISDYLERNKGYYFDSLTIARQTGNIKQWLEFFLIGIKETADSSIAVFGEILRLRERIAKDVIPALKNRAEAGSELITHLYIKPIIDVAEAQEKLGVSLSTASRLIKDLERLGILVEYTGHSRNRRYMFKEYLDLFA